MPHIQQVHGMALDVKGQPLDLAVIGNCRTAALVDTGGRVVWWCFPRFDSDPAFSRLLTGNDEKGFCDVTLEGQATTEAAYVRNTAIVETVIRDDSGNAVRITDFTPRFKRFERTFNLRSSFVASSLLPGFRASGLECARPSTTDSPA